MRVDSRLRIPIATAVVALLSFSCGTPMLPGDGASDNGDFQPVTLPTWLTASATSGGQNLYITPGRLEFGASLNELTLHMQYTAGTPLEYTLSTDANWIELPDPTGAVQDGIANVPVRINRAALPAETVAGTITITTAAFLPIEIAVFADEAPDLDAFNNGRQLNISAHTLDFGYTSQRLALILTNGSDTRLTYYSNDDVEWAQAHPTVLVADPGPAIMFVEVDRDGLSPGFYQGTLTVDSSNGETASVTLEMQVAGAEALTPRLETSTNLLDFGTGSTQETFVVTNPGAEPLDFTLTPSGSWFAASPTAGTATAGGQVITVTIDRAALSPGEHQGLLAVTAATGQTLEVAILSEVTSPTQETEPLPADGLFAWPSSDERIDCIVNFNAYAIQGIGDWLGYAPSHWAQALTLSGGQGPRDVPDRMAVWNGMVAGIRAANPEILYSSYVSASDTRSRDQLVYYPPEGIPAEELPPNSVRGGMPPSGRGPVNLYDPEIRQAFQDAIVNQVLAHPTPFVYLDNVRHPGTLNAASPHRFDWATVTGHLGAIRERLHVEGIRIVTNLSLGPFGYSDEDAQMLAESVDGMSFELPFHPTLARTTTERMQRNIGRIRQWLDDGKLIQFIDTWAPEGGDPADQKIFMAAMVMMIREPGDALFLTRGFWHPSPPDWATWPTDFGAPLGPYSINGDPPIMAREFENVTLVVDVGATLDAETAADAVTLLWK